MDGSKGSIDSNVVNFDKVNAITYWGPGSGADGRIYNQSSFQAQSSMTVRKRVPSLGDPDHTKEKPFENGTLVAEFPRGKLEWPSWDFLVTFDGPLSGAFNIPGSQTQFRGDLAFPMDSTYPDYPSPLSGAYPPGINVDLLSQAEVKCLNKLKERGVDQTLDWGLVWAERRETANLFRDATVASLRLAKALKRGSAAEALDVLRNDFRAWFTGDEVSLRRKVRGFKREVRRGTRTAAETLELFKRTVLAWNLGVSPLMKDLAAAAELLRTGLLTRDFNVRAVSSYGRVKNDVRRFKHGHGYESTMTLSDSHYYTVVFVARPSFSDAALLEALGLTNLPNLAYQTTARTFIIDYFLAVGPWLSAMHVPRMFEFHDGSWTQSVKRVVTLRLDQAAEKVATGGYTLNYVKRKVYGTFPVPLPPLSFREHELSVKQAVNTGLVALDTLQSLLGLKVK